MGAQIKLSKLKTYKGEKIGDIIIKSTNNPKAINLSYKLNSSAIMNFY